jgi:TrmH family RNA methyltransferase
LRTTDRLFESVADTQSPQGVAALVRHQGATMQQVLRGIPLLVALVGVQDPGNVGTIVRVAEAFGATGVATLSVGTLSTADPLGPKALRASAGSALRLPILCEISNAPFWAQLNAADVKVYAAVAATGQARASVPQTLRPWDVDWKKPSALLIGNEGSGLPQEMVRAAEARVAIPQATATTPVGIESLNAAMAATVLLYEAMRQRI